MGSADMRRGNASKKSRRLYMPATVHEPALGCTFLEVAYGSKGEN